MSTVKELSAQATLFANQTLSFEISPESWLEIYSEELVNLTIKDLSSAQKVDCAELVKSSAVERKLIYQVYEAEVNDCFKFIGYPLLETDNLGKCCVMCYDLSKELTNRRFVTWQENIQALRENCCELDRIKENG